ncbi:MAG: hypothetical protein HY327_04100 [Chloroflexi bacterium]|nr:hypothetical protein [Chloroflexota bacterium]
MFIHRSKFGIGALLIALSLLACDSSTLVASLAATPTPTRTPRPTFTPQPEITDTPQPSPIPAATATSTRAVVTAAPRPPTAKPAPTQVPAPQFTVQLTESYPCPQTSPVYEIAARIQDPNPPKRFVGGYVLEIRSPDGSFSKTGISVPSGQEYESFLGGTDCKAQNFWYYNLKVDAAEVRGHAPFLARIVRSTTDRTPISADVTIDFMQPTRWIIYYFAPPK